MRVFFFLFFGVITQLIISCTYFQQEKKISEYLIWLNDESNGLVKEKYINGLVFTAKYLPPDYLVYQELKNDTLYSLAKKDSLLNLYSSNLTFLLSVKPDEREENSKISDVMYLGVTNMSDYKERVLLMNFEMKEFLQLQTETNVVYSPVLTNMENTYSLGNGRSITCVFAPLKDKKEFNNTSTLDLVWDDEIFESGRNHFVFNRKDFSSVPRLIY